MSCRLLAVVQSLYWVIPIMCVYMESVADESCIVTLHSRLFLLFGVSLSEGSLVASCADTPISQSQEHNLQEDLEAIGHFCRSEVRRSSDC